MQEIDQFFFFWFENQPIFISAFIDLFIFDFKSGEYWLIVIFGLATGITIANYINGKWKPHPIGILILIFLPANFFIFQISYVDEAQKKYIDYKYIVENKENHYLKLSKTKRDKIKSSVWMSEFKVEKIIRDVNKNRIIKSLSLQFLFTFFSVLSFIFIVFNFNPTIKNYRDKIEAKREEEKARKTFNERIAKKQEEQKCLKFEDDQEKEKQRKIEEQVELRRLEEERLKLEIEKEKTKQVELSASIELKRLEKERPAKEENLSKILEKIEKM